jgi:CBS domain-containing protein
VSAAGTGHEPERVWATDARTGLEVLAVVECYTLLATQSLGRLAVTTNAGLPIIFPVGYVVDGRDIVFRSAGGTKLAAAQSRPVAFEVDAADTTSHTGWSVVVAGRAEPVVQQSEVERLDALRIPRWTRTGQPRWLRLHPDAISGRRIPKRRVDPMGIGAPVVAGLPAGPVVAMGPEATLAEVGAAMVRHGVSVVLVGDVAVVERDLTRALARGLPGATAAREHCGRRPVTVGPTASVVDAALAMVHAEAHHLVIAELGQPVALITLADTLAALLRAGEIPAWVSGLGLALRAPD